MVSYQAFPLALDGLTVGVGLDAHDSTLASLLAMAKIFLCFWDSLAGVEECLMLVLTLEDTYAQSAGISNSEESDLKFTMQKRSTKLKHDLVQTWMLVNLCFSH